MKNFVTNKNETVRLFKNPILEYFSHIHPATPLFVFIPVLLLCLYVDAHVLSPFLMVGLWFFGVLLWTLLEYSLHRFGFHYHAKSDLGKRVLFLVHGIHHDYPRDSTRLVMPLLVSVPLASLVYFIFWGLFAPYHNTIFAGFGFGYLAYDCLHYAFHHFQIKNRFFAFLKIYHLKHHYNDPDSGFGVSNPLWDIIFRTMPKEVDQNEINEWKKLTTA